MRVKLTQVGLRLRGRQIVEPLSVSLEAGQVTALLGPNGAGKTSLLRMIAGLLTPTSGEIEVCGFKLPQQVTLARTKVGFLSPGMRLYDALSPRESLQFFGRLHGHRGPALVRMVEELAVQFGLTGFWKRRFSLLSSGERQRALVALLRLHDPEVLVLDEVTASLDLIASQFVHEFILSEQKRGKCILFSTHLLQEAEALCDRILLMSGGQIVLQGTPTEVKASAQTDSLGTVILKALRPKQDATAVSA